MGMCPSVIGSFHRVFKYPGDASNRSPKQIANSRCADQSLIRPVHVRVASRSASFRFRETSSPLFTFAPPPFGLPFVDVGIVPSKSNRDIAEPFHPRTPTRYYGSSLTANWDIGDHELVSITAFDKYAMGWAPNIFNFLPILALPFPAFFIDGDLNDQRDVETELISQEFRLVSPVNERFDYVLGLYAAVAKVDEALYS